MRGPRSWLIRPFVYLVALAAVVLATIVLVYAVQARVRLGDLHAWHRIELREEAGAAHPEAFESFDAYLRQEDKLFAELRERVYSDPAAVDDLTLGRYNPLSTVARLALDTPYNRSFELAPAGEPRGAVLLKPCMSRAAPCCSCTACPIPLTACAASRSCSKVAATTCSRCDCRVMARCPPSCATCAGRTGTPRPSRPRSTPPPAADPASRSTSPAIRPARRSRRSIRCARSTIRRYRSREASMCYPRQL